MIKLEVGKRYELNNGEVHECAACHWDDPMHVTPDGYGPFHFEGIGLYHQDGRFGSQRADFSLSVKRCVDDPVAWGDMTDAQKVELLLAYHKGEVIEWSYDIPWKTAYDSERGWPTWDDRAYYRSRPKREPVLELVDIYTGYPLGGSWADYCEDDDTYCLTYPTIDGKIPTGTYTNADGEQIIVEDI